MTLWYFSQPPCLALCRFHTLQHCRHSQFKLPAPLQTCIIIISKDAKDILNMSDPFEFQKWNAEYELEEVTVTLLQERGFKSYRSLVNLNMDVLKQDFKTLPSGEKMLNWHQNYVNSWHQLTINHRSKMTVFVASAVNIKLTWTIGIKLMLPLTGQQLCSHSYFLTCWLLAHAGLCTLWFQNRALSVLW